MPYKEPAKYKAYQRAYQKMYYHKHKAKSKAKNKAVKANRKKYSDSEQGKAVRNNGGLEMGARFAV